MLEAYQHEKNAFVTLTYDDANLPADRSLCPRDLQLYLKRLRKAVSPSRFRFYAVGEYGDQTNRPHYHVGFFGYPGCDNGRSVYRLGRGNCCYWCDLVRDTWGKGNIDVGELVPDSAQYLAGYVTKKMTSKDDPRLMGRHPEFARQSNRPGIGAVAMQAVATVLLHYNREDVPLALAHGTKELPLGRYLRRKLREAMGKDVNCSPQELQEIAAEMQALRASWEASPEFSSKDASLIGYMSNHEHGQRLRNFEARSSVFKSRDRSL